MENGWLMHYHIDKFEAVSILCKLFAKKNLRLTVIKAFYMIQNVENEVNFGFESERDIIEKEMENFLLTESDNKNEGVLSEKKIDSIHFIVEKIHSSFWKKMSQSLKNLMTFNKFTIFVKSIKNSRVSIFFK